MARAADSQDAVSYNGRQSFFATRDGQTMWAAIAIEARSGQGTEFEVLSRTGEQLIRRLQPGGGAPPGWSTTTCSTCSPATTR